MKKREYKGMTVIHADEGKILESVDGKTRAEEIYLGVYDSESNYVEIDIPVEILHSDEDSLQ